MRRDYRYGKSVGKFGCITGGGSTHHRAIEVVFEANGEIRNVGEIILFGV
jgi:hypothetical protein